LEAVGHNIHDAGWSESAANVVNLRDAVFVEAKTGAGRGRLESKEGIRKIRNSVAWDRIRNETPAGKVTSEAVHRVLREEEQAGGRRDDRPGVRVPIREARVLRDHRGGKIRAQLLGGGHRW
jgi:hypothetical protein